MAKFKKGDRVRRVSGEVTDYDPTPIGGINIVDQDGSNIPYGLNKSVYGGRSVITEEEYEMAEDAACENRLTFTVGGQEFYVGQTVWSTAAAGVLEYGDELEVVGSHPDNDNGIVVRKVGTWVTCGGELNKISSTKPHEWKFGDWARSPDGVVCFVMTSADRYGKVMIAMKGNWTYLPATELTYISTAEIPA